MTFSIPGVWGACALAMADDPEILPSSAPSLPAPAAARALVGRLVRSGAAPDSLLALIAGPLAEAVATAGDYAGKAIAPGTVETYKADWADFSRRARRHGVDPAGLPVHPVVVAAWLATLAPAMGRSALRRRVAAIAWHHRSFGHAWQSGHAAIRQTLAGIARAHSRPVRPAAPDLHGRQAVDRRLPARPRRFARPGAVPGRPRRRLPPLGARGDRCRQMACRSFRAASGSRRASHRAAC